MSERPYKICIAINTEYSRCHMLRMLRERYAEAGIEICVLADSLPVADEHEKERDYTVHRINRKLPRALCSQVLEEVAQRLWKWKHPGTDHEVYERTEDRIRYARRWLGMKRRLGLCGVATEQEVGELCERMAKSVWVERRCALVCGTFYWRLFAILLAGIMKLFGVTPEGAVRLSARWERPTGVADFLRREQVDLVFAEAGVFLAPYLADAYRAGVPLCYYVPSWDRALWHGVFPVPFDSMLVWGNMTADLVKAYHGLGKDQVFVVGSANFDAYHHVREMPTRDDIFERYGVEKHRKLITLFMGQACYDATNVPIVEYLLDLLREAVLGEPCHLLIRLYPTETHCDIKSRIPEGLPVSIQDDFDFGYDYAREGWDSIRGLSLRAATLKHSDVLLSPGGSATFDAMWFEKPVINVVYDAVPVPYHLSTHRWSEQSHMVHMLDAKGVRVARSNEQLRDQLIDALCHPERMKTEMADSLCEVIGYKDGQTHQRMVQALRQLCERYRGSKK